MSKHDEGNAPKLVVEQGGDAPEVAPEAREEAGEGAEKKRAKQAGRKERKKRITREDLEGAMGFVQGLGAAAWVRGQSSLHRGIWVRRACACDSHPHHRVVEHHRHRGLRGRGRDDRADPRRRERHRELL